MGGFDKLIAPSAPRDPWELISEARQLARVLGAGKRIDRTKATKLLQNLAVALEKQLRSPAAAAPEARPRGTPKSPATPVEDDNIVRARLRALASREPPGALLSMRALRATVPELDKPRFDAAVMRLSRTGEATIHHHDFPSSLPDAERAALVVDEHGVHYVGIAPRDARPARPAAPSSARRRASQPPAGTVLDAVRAAVDPQLGLVGIANVVRGLQARGMALEEIHRELLAADDRGEIELRPESGGEFMGKGDEQLVPKGPRGTVFTYAQVRDDRGGKG